MLRKAILSAARVERSCIPWDERTGHGWLCQLILRSSRRADETEARARAFVAVDMGDPQYLAVLATLVTVEDAPQEVLQRVATVAMANAPRLADLGVPAFLHRLTEAAALNLEPFEGEPFEEPEEQLDLEPVEEVEPPEDEQRLAAAAIPASLPTPRDLDAVVRSKPART
eukprot:Skav233157  [mRNA]  locus=scaffold1669:342148:348549:+ [translate_table: standard]